ncbi:conserved hypothetical protein [Catenulispora acidiphila DSM 44928]|uniref:DUF6311 domain-containing protein n=1 Tax=Catenulispora acidiphila (strain DSM 44928 / JCM 14897 / NBRC 102108 / NRRL B-24433 / ID139908) TaxID=479433 RepID=C7Q229_CATAD|nr:glycosyltransferase family 87 protein [Catenulispora acidiphila]ACU77566.1 conserved hypothetical protein [Catenulispora acidiphila DSM 44928]
MTESPSGQGAPEHDSEAALLTEPPTPPATPSAPPAPSTPSVPGQPTRDDVETDSVEDLTDGEVAENATATDADTDSDSATDETSAPGHRPDAPRNPLRRAAQRVVDEILDPSIGFTLALVYLGLAMFLTWKLLFHPTSSVMAGNPYDQFYFEWQLTAVEHALTHLQNPLFTHAMNAPDGMNLAANPQIIGPAAVLTPITALFGAPVSFALLTTFNLAATATTWRWFLRRHVVRTETAAFVGGLFMGFSPSMMSHSLAHPNLAGQWLVPLIVGAALRLREPEPRLRNGIVLGVLIAAQVFVGEELLLLAAMGFTLFLVAYVLMRPRQAWAEAAVFLRGAGVAIVTAGALLAYPLSFQFFGPMSFKGIPFDVAYYSADLKSYAVYPNQELWGDPAKLDPLAPGGTEQAALVGWALLLVVALLAIWLIRNAAVRALLIAALVLVTLSVGPTPVFDHTSIKWWPLGPTGVWTHMQNLPLFSSSLPVRSALAVSWIIGVLLALGLDKAVLHRQQVLRGVVFGGVVASLVPLVPRVFDTSPRLPIPHYFTSGAWKECVSPGHNTIVGVPLSDGGDRTNQTWSTAADTAFNIPQGPVMAPNSPTDKQVAWAKNNVLWTAQWLAYIYQNGGGATPVVNSTIQNRVRLDLGTWQANCVVAADGTQNLAAIKNFLDQAIAPGKLEGDVIVWKEPVG